MTAKLRKIVGGLIGNRARRAARQATLVSDPIRYVALGLLEPRGVFAHRLRKTHAKIWLRHPGDSWTFEEIFGARAYEVPPIVSAKVRAAPRVLDLGANVGLFGAFMLEEMPGARIIGYEPDPGNSRVLELTLANALAGGRYSLRKAASGPRDGSATFAVGLGGRSHLGADSGLSLTVEIRDVLGELAACDLAKIDIEGGEWPILADARLAERGPLAIVLEYHPAGCPTTDPGAHARELLERAGYAIVPSPRLHEEQEFPPGQGVIWALRRERA